MSEPLKESHPMLMVQNVLTFGVVIATNGQPFRVPIEEMRKALVQNLPAGTGVGQMTCTDHGPYLPPIDKPATKTTKP
jgi:hypothetical protein